MVKRYISEEEKDIVMHSMLECCGWDYDNRKPDGSVELKKYSSDLPWLCRDNIGYYVVAYSELSNVPNSEAFQLSI